MPVLERVSKLVPSHESTFRRLLLSKNRSASRAVLLFTGEVCPQKQNLLSRASVFQTEASVDHDHLLGFCPPKTVLLPKPFCFQTQREGLFAAKLSQLTCQRLPRLSNGWRPLAAESWRDLENRWFFASFRRVVGKTALQHCRPFL